MKMVASWAEHVASLLTYIRGDVLSRSGDAVNESDGSGWLLAIDTSTEQAGVALTDGERTAELSWPAGRTHTESVLAQIDHLRGLLSVPKADIRAIGVAIGPGTFTGLRVGVSIAKGWALFGRLPVVGVPTLAAAAAPFAPLAQAVAVLLAAGRGRVVWSVYAHGPSGWGEEAAPRNITFPQFMMVLAGRPDLLVSGELTAAQHAQLRAAGHERIASAQLQNRRPGAVAAIAWERWHAGEVDDLMALEPVYVHGVTKPAPSIHDRL